MLRSNYFEKQLNLNFYIEIENLLIIIINDCYTYKQHYKLNTFNLILLTRYF